MCLLFACTTILSIQFRNHVVLGRGPKLHNGFAGRTKKAYIEQYSI
uniref:Uncharacterized protein n=1 Tax=Rhodopseudomonas palustris (strain ATCC BAA-98 / CGA009) TaxID=258594 RepID=Q6N6U6_RHOPA|nr:hypothetical protein RPA2518 [Rhodopseudomonas palustris CGA009]